MATFGLREDQSTPILGMLTVSYVIFVNFVPKLIKVFDKKAIIVVGLLGSSLGALVIAPLFLPNRWWVMLIGLPLMGFANAMCVLPAIPQYIDFMSESYPQAEMKRALSDMASGLFMSSYALGSLIGPLSSG